MPGLSGLSGPQGLSAIMGGAFAGAYDAIANLVHVYEPARRTLSAYTGNLVRLRRIEDNAELDFTYDADGNLDDAAITVWTGTAYVVTVYDQVGDDDVTQATAANQPTYTASAQNSKPGMTFDGTNDMLQGAFTNGGALSQPFINYAVAKLDATAVNDGTIRLVASGDDNTNEMMMGTYAVPVPDEWYIAAGSSLPTAGFANSATIYLWSALFNGASSTLWFNGTSRASGSAGAENPDGLTMGARGSAVRFWKGLITSIVICDPSHSTAQRTAMQTAMNDYWAVY